MEEGFRIVLITIGVCIGILIAFYFVNKAFRCKYRHSLLPGALLLTVVNSIYIYMEMKGMNAEAENPFMHFLPLILVWALVIVLDIAFFRLMGIVAILVQAVVSIASLFTIIAVIGILILTTREDVKYEYYYVD